jgi:DhnA family fructose-bisphosphate aldolase class Ia
MPAKTEKQRKFFGAVMSAKKGKKEVTGAAKKAAKEMSADTIKDFLKKESFDSIVNAVLQD